MRHTITILIIFISLTSCQLNDNSRKDCIEFVDSLTINLEKTRIKVVIIDLSQKVEILSYTSIYKDHIIVLNKCDSFYTFKLNCLERDYVFENEINGMRFKRAFVISDTLYGIDSINQAFYYNFKKEYWLRISKKLPLFNSVPIYENDKYICYSICQGEFGGLVFFYNKQTLKITFAPTTCVVSLIEYLNGFFIVSNLGHMIGFTNVIHIDNPDSLLELPDSLNTERKWNQIFAYYPILKDTFIVNKGITLIYNSYSKFLTSGFRIRGENFFITAMNYKNKFGSYLTKIDKDSLKIIQSADTIFSNLSSSHGEIQEL